MTNTDFKKLIQKALETRTPLELAETFKTSVPTIKRWASGETFPHRVIREAVVKFLNKKK